MYYVIVFLAALAGAGLPIQSAVNARLRQSVESPALSALISFLVGGLVLVLIAAAGVFGRGRMPTFGDTPWWAWIDGCFGVFVVLMAIIGLPRIGAGTLVAATIFGQLVAAIVIDHFGFLGVPRVPVNPTRLIGAVLLFVGALLMRRT